MKALHFDINKYLDQYYATSEVLVSFKGMITESKIGRLLDELELNLKCFFCLTKCLNKKIKTSKSL
jgi:hypothetical protein